jgi:hypothetical protein
VADLYGTPVVSSDLMPADHVAVVGALKIGKRQTFQEAVDAAVARGEIVVVATANGASRVNGGDRG